MNTYLIIFIGAGIGGVLRFWLSSFIYQLFEKSFPLGTLAVNVSGCFLMGFFFILTLSRFGQLAGSIRAFVLIGILGGYTTFSSFSIETISLIENGSWFNATLNILLTVTLCLLATGLGIIWGRTI